MTALTCNMTPGTPEWERHLAEIKRLEMKATRNDNSALALALAVLLLRHKALEWAASTAQMAAVIECGAEHEYRVVQNGGGG